jgi:hypothetical protein
MGWDTARLTSLRQVAAELFPREPDQRRLVTEAGLREAAIAFDPSADDSWFDILQYARGQDMVDALVDKILEESPNETIRKLKNEVPVPLVAGASIKTDVTWKGPPNARGVLEQVTGARSALVPVSFLAVGLTRARAVAKVQLASGAAGSGFLLRDGLLLTNHHVLPDAASAATGVAIFNYQETPDGLDEPMESFHLDPGAFFATSEADDWSAVRVAGDAGRWGALDLKRAAVHPDDRVNIVQHPGGGPKQISFFSNLVVYVGGGRVQYLTDTLPGSSGSPVFDRDWNVVALHHSGGWLTEPGSDPKNTFYRNEGILIDNVIDGLAAASRPAAP